MKKLSVISSIFYMLALMIYFIFGKSDSSLWTAYFFINNSTYIICLLLDNAFQTFNTKYISMVLTAVSFQVLLIMFELYLFVWCDEDYFKLVNGIFWSGVWFVVGVIYIVTNKIIHKWVNG